MTDKYFTYGTDLPDFKSQKPSVILPEPDKRAKKILSDTHPGFTIICHRCDSSDVGVESDIMYSELSGLDGEVSLKCARCGLTVNIWDS